MTDSWVTTHDARPFNDRVVHKKQSDETEISKSKLEVELNVEQEIFN